METKNNQVLPVLLLILGFVLIFFGFSTPGLWPWQLPACFVGGYIVGAVLSRKMFDKYKY
jgi:membrane-bound ClpP family serine protease